MAKTQFLMGDSITVVRTDDDSVCSLLSEQMACVQKGYQYSPAYQSGLWDGTVKFFKRAARSFPTGLTHYASQIVIDKYGHGSVEILDGRIKPSSNKPLPTNIVLRDYQKEIVDQALRCTRGVIEVATGGGKTEIAIAIIAQLNLPALFIVDSIDIVTQMVQRLRKAMPNICIRQITGGKAKLINGTNPLVTVTTYQTLVKHPELVKGSKFHVKFSDECHGVAAKTWLAVMERYPAYYSFGLSGSIDASYEDPVRYCHVLGSTGRSIVKLPASRLVDEGVLARPEIRMLKYPCKTERGLTWMKEYDETITKNDLLNHKIVPAILKKHPEDQILILVNRIAHGAEISSYTGIPFIHGGDTAELRERTLQNFRNRNIRTLIASKIFRQGVDIPDVDVIVSIGSDDSYKSVFQKLGRGLRKTSRKDQLMYYDIFPASGGIIQRHATRRINKYQYLGFPVKVLEVKLA